MTSKKRIGVRISSVYFEDQITDLDKIAEVRGVSRSQLLKDGADEIIKINKSFLDKANQS